MRVTAIVAGLLASVGRAIPHSQSDHALIRQAKGACDSPVSLNASTNIWKEYKLNPNILYRRKVEAAAEVINNVNLKEKAQKVADAGTFTWIRGREQVSKIEEVAKDVPCNHVVGLVLDGLPLKTCSATGLGPDKDPWDYRQEYVDPIVRILKSFPNTAFALIVEPDVILDVVANGQMAACQQLAKSYRENVPYALKEMNLPNVILYLDACNGGCFGWKENQKPGAQELINTWKNAGEPAQFRGVAINVAGYNAWDLSPGEMFKGENTCYDLENPARNEKRYLQILNKEIKKTNMPFHSIMDTSRNGIIGVREYWMDWCNVNGAGFGRPPSTETGDDLLDAFVWAKAGGESDGTSNSNEFVYDSSCGKADAFKPMPPRDEWSQAYFEMLLSEWNPTRQHWREKRQVQARCGR